MLVAQFGHATRPDEITRTGVIQPFAVQQGPVRMAQGVPGQFLNPVRPDGPSVVTPPSPQEIAAAAVAVAREFQRGKGAAIKMGKATVKVYPNKKAPPGIPGAIVETARSLMRGAAVMVQVGPQAAVVRPADGWPGIANAARAGVATAIVRGPGR
jgi:hypothetical protein